MEGGLRAAGTIEIAGLSAPPDERRAMILAEHARELFPDLKHGEPRLWMGFRPSTPDSLPILGEVRGHPRLFLAFGHGHFGMTGGPPWAKTTDEGNRTATPARASRRRRTDDKDFSPANDFAARHMWLCDASVSIGGSN